MQSGQIGISGLPNKHGAIDQQKKKVENPQKEWIQAKELQDHSWRVYPLGIQPFCLENHQVRVRIPLWAMRQLYATPYYLIQLFLTHFDNI